MQQLHPAAALTWAWWGGAGGAQGMTKQAFKDIMAVDKKVQDGRLRLILLKGPLGSCVVTGDFDSAALEATLDAFTH